MSTISIQPLEGAESIAPLELQDGAKPSSPVHFREGIKRTPRLAPEGDQSHASLSSPAGG